MKKTHHSSKSLFCSTPQSNFSTKKIEYDERLKELSSVKSNLFGQKAMVDLIRSPSGVLENSLQDLNLKLKLEQNEKKSIQMTLAAQQEKFREIERELEEYKAHIRDLEAKNRLNQSSLIEKDRMLSRYICEMLILKQEVEKLVNPSSTLGKNLQNSLRILYNTDDKPELKKLEVEPNPLPITLGKSQKYYELEIARLQKQLQETQELYKLTNSQLKTLIEKSAKQDTEYMSLKSKLQNTQIDFSTASSALLRNTGEKDFISKNLFVELGELRKKRDEQDLEISRLEKRHKASLNELKEDLAKSREKTLEVIETKTLQDKEISGLKMEKKEIMQDAHFKDLKISDLTAQIASLNQELKLLKNIVKNKTGDSMDGKVRQKYEQRIQELSQKNEILENRTQQLESEKQKNTTLSQTQSKTIVQQLSNIILSRDKQGNFDNKDLTRNLSKLLIENHEVFEGILTDYFGKSYESLREIMQEKLEELLVMNEELQKENKLITDQLKTESIKRVEIVSQLQVIEKEVEKKNKRTLSSEPNSLKKVLYFDSDESEPETKALEFEFPELLCLLQCEAAALENFLIYEDS